MQFINQQVKILRLLEETTRHQEASLNEYIQLNMGHYIDMIKME